MDKLPESGVIRLFLERRGKPTAYTLHTPLPGATLDRRIFSVPTLMAREGLNWSQIAAGLAMWSQHAFGVLKTTVSYTGRSYVIAVLAKLDTTDQLRALESSLRSAMPSELLALHPQTYILHPADAEEPVLTAVDVVCVFPAAESHGRVAA